MRLGADDVDDLDGGECVQIGDMVSDTGNVDAGKGEDLGN